MHKSNHAIDAIDATHWSIYAQVPEEEHGEVVDVAPDRPGYVPRRFLNEEGTARLTRANDPASGLIYCHRCKREWPPRKGGSPRGGTQHYICSECRTANIRIITEPTGDYAIN